MARHVGLDSLPGLSLCLRLLALVEVLGTRRLAARHVQPRPGRRSSPALLAARAPRRPGAHGRFRGWALRGMLGRALPPNAPSTERPPMLPRAVLVSSGARRLRLPQDLLSSPAGAIHRTNPAVAAACRDQSQQIIARQDRSQLHLQRGRARPAARRGRPAFTLRTPDGPDSAPAYPVRPHAVNDCIRRNTQAGRPAPPSGGHPAAARARARDPRGRAGGAAGAVPRHCVRAARNSPRHVCRASKRDRMIPSGRDRF
jgi:hypothetical protein